MAAFRSDRPLGQIGRDHLQLCADLVDGTGELMQATSAAVESLSDRDIRRACASAENSATLLNARLDAFLQGTLPGPAVSFVFHASIYTAALRAKR